MMAGLFDVYSTCVGFIADHVAVLTAAFTLILFARIAMGVFPSGLRQVFGRGEIPFGVAVRIVFLCWRSRAVQRTFFEFALVKSQGKKMEAWEWRELYGDFATFLADEEYGKRGEINIRNCTHLTGVDFVAAVERYFEFLKGSKTSEFYSIGRLDDYWHTRIHVAEAYITPSVLLAGLMSKFDSDWEIFIEQYRAALSEHEKSDLSTSELYGLFSWLLWGPSREISWQSGWDGLCQLAYGDENNSLPVFANARNGTLEVLRENFMSSKAQGMFGGAFTASIRLVPKMEFVRQTRFSMDIRNAYFIDKISSDKSLSFIPELETVEPVEVRIAGRYYSTAYLWVVFERDNADAKFHPEQAVAFFEHANLADASVCNFLKCRLAEKVLAHFRAMSEHPATAARKYRMVCGMNATLEDFCKEKLASAAKEDSPFAAWLREHVSLVARHEASAVFKSFDDFFQEASFPVSFLDVDPADRLACAELALFYVGAYSDAFPNEDERESLPNLIRYLKESRRSGKWDFRILLAKDRDGLVTGGVVFDYFRDTNSIVIEFLCVDREFRNRHVGTALWLQTLKVADTLALKHGKRKAEHVFCEVDSPAIRQDNDLSHLAFWRNNWFGKMDLEYVQPSLGDGQKPVHGLWLLGLSRSASSRDTMAKSIVEKTIWNYLHYSMGIVSPEKDESFKAMQTQLSGRDRVSLSRF